MLIFVALIVRLLLFESLPDLGPWLSEVSKPIHHWCVNHTPQSRWSSYYSAIVCGEEITGSSAEVFRTTGLIHILVVSGSHLVILDQVLQKVLPPKTYRILSLPLLSFYTLVCQANPPVVRAWMGHVFQAANRRFAFGWAGPQLCFWVGGVLIFLCPSWMNSWSFALSWLCSLALTFENRSPTLSAPLTSCLMIFLLLWLPMAAFSPSHPLSVLCNWLIAPVIGSVLLPMSAVPFFLPQLASMTDLIWSALNQVLEVLQPMLSIASSNLPLTIWQLWIYVAFVQTLMTVIHRQGRRGRFH